MWPKLRHVATCLSCGWREATLPFNACAGRCPHCGSELEHDDVAFYSAAELKDVPRQPRPLVLKHLL